MCQPTAVSHETKKVLYSKDASVETPKTGWFRPIHPLALAAMLPFCPEWFFFNRGFTQWFHWGFVFYLITGKSEWARRFLVVQGGGVCAGWYAAVAFEYFYYGRLCHLLYNNMPAELRAIYLVNGKLASGGIITDNLAALSSLALTHLIDLLAHPIMTYIIWKMHKSRGGTFRSLCSMDILVANYIWCRVYSCTHWYYNDGVLGFFYNGWDVYNIDNAESYTIAYIGEGLFYLFMVGCYFYFKSGESLQSGTTRDESEDVPSSKQLAKEDKQRPKLVQSESSFSTTSIDS